MPTKVQYISEADPLVVGHYYYLHPDDYNSTYPPRIMQTARELGRWSTVLPVLIEQSDFDKALDSTIQIGIQIGKPVDERKFLLDCLRSLGGGLVERGVMVGYQAPSLNSGRVCAQYPGDTKYYSMYRDLFIHPELVRQRVESDDFATRNSGLKVILRLVDREGHWIAKV